MGDIPNLPLFVAQIWAKNDYAKELQSTIFWSLIEAIYFILGWEEKRRQKQIDATEGSK